MEYKRLSELQNTYPNIRAYNEEGSRIVLNGLYPETNKILFAKPSLDAINVVPNTSFRFILSILKSETDQNPKFYTSEKYYNDLKASIQENNPYFSLESIKNEFIVTINIDETLVRFANLKPIEEKWGVVVSKNIFLSDNGLDYVELIKYIDWVVSKPNPLEIDTGGVIPAENIGLWASSSLDFSTLTYKNKNEVQSAQSSNIDIQKIQNELNEVNATINKIEGQLTSNKFTDSTLFRILGLVSFFPFSLLLFNNKRKKEAKQKLQEKLNEYKNKKTDLEKKINEAQKILSERAASTPTLESLQTSYLQRIRETVKNQL